MHRRAILLLLTCLALSLAAPALAGDGEWTHADNNDNDGDWSDPAMWINGVIADGPDAKATFAPPSLTFYVDTSIHDGDRTIGHIHTGSELYEVEISSRQGNTGGWPDNPRALILSAPSSTPTISGEADVRIDAPLEGTEGIRVDLESGVHLRLDRDNSYTGLTTVAGDGNIYVETSGSLGATGWENRTIWDSVWGSLVMQPGMGEHPEDHEVLENVEIAVWKGDVGWHLEFSGQLQVDGNVQMVQWDHGGTCLLSGPISGSGRIYLDDYPDTDERKITELTGNNASYSGEIDVDANNTLIAGQGNSLGEATLVILEGDGRLELAGHETFGGLTGSGAVASVAGGSYELATGEDHVDRTFSGTIEASLGGFAKVGDGRMSLQCDASAYAGTFEVEAGTLGLGLESSVSAANLVDVSAGGVLELEDDASVGGLAGDGLVDTAGYILTLAGDGSSYTGEITGAGALVKTGSGTQTLAGPLTYSGSTTVNGSGVLMLASSPGDATTSILVTEQASLHIGPGNSLTSGIQVTLDPEATLEVVDEDEDMGTLLGSGTVQVNEGRMLGIGQDDANFTFSGPIQGPGTFKKVGSGTVTLEGTVSAGTLRAAEGVLVAGTGDAMTDTVVLDISTGGTFRLNDGEDFGGLTGSGTFDTNGHGFGVGKDDASTTFNGRLIGGGHIDKKGTGTLTLSGDNANTGNSTAREGVLYLTGNNADMTGDFHVRDGATLRLGSGNSLSSQTRVNMYTGSTLELEAGEGFGSLAGDGQVNLGASSLTLGEDDSGAEFSGAIDGTGGVNKRGAGTVTLNGASAFSGHTWVQGGALVAAHDQALGTSQVHISGGTLQVDATLANEVGFGDAGGALIGGGALTMSLLVKDGALLSPGVGECGTVVNDPDAVDPVEEPPCCLGAGDLTLAGGATLRMEIRGSGACSEHDQITVDGDFSTEGATLELLGGYEAKHTHELVIVKNDGMNPISGTFDGLAEGSYVEVGEFKGSITYVGGDGNDVALLAGEPDLQVAKRSDLTAQAVPFTPWTWTLSVSNTGDADAGFVAGQALLRDDLPAGLDYGTPQVATGDTGDAEHIACTIEADALTCEAQGGEVVVPPQGGGFEVSFTATAITAGVYQNPAAQGVCRVDPDDTEVEQGEGNNDCADSVTVGEDCNGNGVADSEDIDGGTSADMNMDGIPDECQQDFGDAPSSYDTARADDGARHFAFTDLYLGDYVDAEPDGSPSAQADGDDTTDTPDDEDGVTFATDLIPGEQVDLIVKASGAGILHAWLDVDLDGAFGVNERIIDGQLLVEGDNTLTFTLADDAAEGTSFARFRFCAPDDLCDTPTGAADSGEVEDYQVTVNADPDDDDDGVDDEDDECPDTPQGTTVSAKGCPCDQVTEDATCDGIDDDCDLSVDEDYVSEATTCGLGACAATGETVCEGGAVRDSCLEGQPLAEDDTTCDAVDDDCDGSNDEDFVSEETSCGQGVCHALGATACEAGAVVDSCEPGQPHADDDTSCNDTDDDCDGAEDEDYVSEATTCGFGVCAATGETACEGGAVRDSCLEGQPLAADDTTCDGVDDDCDGASDEDYVSEATTCGAGVCAATGATACEAGAVIDSCDAGQPLAADDATCDGVDDDCDGDDDEDYVTSATSCGVGACAAAGELTCNAGTVVDSCQPGTAAADDATCDAVDDDCDGTNDEDYAATATTCGLGACAAAGELTCDEGTEVDSCVTGTPAADDATCDGADDDCDGEVDEDYTVATTTCGLGACAAAGERTCEAGTEIDSCVAGEPLAEDDATCDAVDDDCDDEVDEDYVATATACGVGACAAAGEMKCEAGAEVDSCTEGAPLADDDATCDGVDDDCDGVTDNDGALACDDGDPCTDDACGGETGCAYTDNALPCDDGDACTTVDACVAGACVGAEPVACEASDGCHLAGACDPATGLCDDPVAPDDTPCDDQDACTDGDACLAGACAGAPAVVCEALGACFDVGVCDPLTGLCSNPYATAGSACDDADPCTDDDICIAGACTGQPVGPELCDDGDPCTNDACDPVAGCAYTPNEATCDDDDLCTLTACQDGACAVTGWVEGCCHVDEDCDDQALACWAPDHACVPISCRVCADDEDCGPAGNLCVALPSGSYCGVDCSADEAACPEGTTCADVDGGARQCLPEAGDCGCTPHAAEACVDGTLVSVDACGQVEETLDDCGGRGCVDQACCLEGTHEEDGACAPDAAEGEDQPEVVEPDAVEPDAIEPDSEQPDTAQPDAGKDALPPPDEVDAAGQDASPNEDAAGADEDSGGGGSDCAVGARPSTGAPVILLLAMLALAWRRRQAHP